MIVNQPTMISEGQFNNHISNTFKSTSVLLVGEILDSRTPLLVGDIPDSRAGEGYLHDELGAFCSARK